jgi:hypothetical protein
MENKFIKIAEEEFASLQSWFEKRLDPFFAKYEDLHDVQVTVYIMGTEDGLNVSEEDWFINNLHWTEIKEGTKMLKVAEHLMMDMGGEKIPSSLGFLKTGNSDHLVVTFEDKKFKKITMDGRRELEYENGVLNEN